MKKIALCFEMCYENSPHIEVIEVEDDITEEELEESVTQMVLDYAHTWFYEVEEDEN